MKGLQPTLLLNIHYGDEPFSYLARSPLFCFYILDTIEMNAAMKGDFSLKCQQLFKPVYGYLEYLLLLLLHYSISISKHLFSNDLTLLRLEYFQQNYDFPCNLF